MKNPFSFLLVALVSLSCGRVDPNKQIDEGHVNDKNVYVSTEIGWSIKIPAGWEVVTKDQLEANDQKGKEAMEKATGTEIDASKLKHLISFKKDQFNLFAATSEPFVEDYPGQYAENSKALNRLILKTYLDQGIKADSSSGITIIDGLKFLTFRTKIFGPDGQLILNQIMYSRLIDGYDVGININYNNENDRDVMLKALTESKFAKE